MTTETGCLYGTAHYIKLPSPNGPVTVGVCRQCGYEREYLAAGPDEATLWSKHGTIGRSSGKWAKKAQEGATNERDE